MRMILLDENWIEEIRNSRLESGADRFDEVWNGDYVMTTVRDVDHQGIVMGISCSINLGLGYDCAEKIRPGAYITDNRTNQLQNFRGVDVAVFLPDTKAELIDPCWYGGPDFACEIVSPNDHTPDRVKFLAKVGTRELLIVNRDPWRLDLIRPEQGTLNCVGKSTVENGSTLTSEIIPFTFQLQQGDPRPAILVGHLESEQSWRV